MHLIIFIDKIGMNCFKNIYKPIRSEGIYEQYIEKLRQKQIQLNKEAFYDAVIKFRSNRYPTELIDKLSKEINPFQYSFQELKEKIHHEYPEYGEEIINESVQYIYNKKCGEAHMIGQSQTIIEDGEQYIRNGRRLKKQDFNYFMGNFQQYKGINIKADQLSFSKSPRKTSKKVLSPRQFLNQSQTKKMKKNDILNSLIAQEIKKQSFMLQPLESITEEDPRDINMFKKEEFSMFLETDRKIKDQSFPRFRDKDVIVQPEGLTGRSDVEDLNYLLGQTQKFQTSHDKSYSMKISKQNFEHLYDARGNLKVRVVKRAIDRMKANDY